ncbi:hypothetical protein NB231_09298 [Nitrococcus mobilis Nb-231]|uniref:Uncharacterized protein n=1 Tax=Nitrococcus mobilis Nb-231 TaxID=314278 RepID=A4BN37_9GAMM|nr:hypothetical protein NB231_09298 [Nitrococcus mobilis Nb-231]
MLSSRLIKSYTDDGSIRAAPRTAALRGGETG